MTCGGCGFVNPADHRYCGGCGARLETADSRLVRERRMVSVLFVDLVGFTTFSESHDAEDVRTMLEGFFELARRAIARHGGVVDKLMGDGVMAVWGAARVREDDAAHAVLAGLEILDGVRQLDGEVAARRRCAPSNALTWARRPRRTGTVQTSAWHPRALARRPADGERIR
jgi:class 3 adenylate cyclase